MKESASRGNETEALGHCPIIPPKKTGSLSLVGETEPHTDDDQAGH